MGRRWAVLVKLVTDESYEVRERDNEKEIFISVFGKGSTEEKRYEGQGNEIKI